MIVVTGAPRSVAEMDFAASLFPCGECGSRDIGKLEMSGAAGERTLSGRCPRCRTPRVIRFDGRDAVDLPAPEPLHLGGPEPSQIITPVQLFEELDRLSPLIVWEPEALGPEMWRANAVLTDRAATCLNELLKFIPAGATAMPDDALDDASRADRDARPERYERAWLAPERDRYLDLIKRRIATGPPYQGKVALADVDLAGHTLGAQNLSRARFERCDLSRADLTGTTLDDAVLLDCNLRGANLGGGTARNVRFEQCDLRDTTWAGRDLTGAVFLDCKLFGASGEPRGVERAVVERPDLSRQGDGGLIGVADDVLALWRGELFD